MQRAVHMQKPAGANLKKVFVISGFIFLAGLFAGIFFNTVLSEENSNYLSNLLASSINDATAGFFSTLFSALISNYFLAVLMLAAALSKLLCPLPYVILWYKSFAVGFCSGLIYLSDMENPFFISLLKILPPAAFIMPAFIVLSAVTFIYSRNEFVKSKRSFREKKDLQKIMIISMAAIAAGCIMEAVCSLFIL